jgi:small subunit ribosomal protein S9
MPAKVVTKPKDPKATPYKSKSKEYTYALGRRKTATARIKLFHKKGDNLINGKSVSAYFPSKIDQKFLFEPLDLTQTRDKFSFNVRVLGSGLKAQRDAVIHGLSRALSLLDRDTYRSSLKKAGLLTRDPRMKESRKVGTGGKARRQKQSPKR